MGESVPDLCREHGMSSACFYQWRSKYGGMDASLMKRMKELEEENRRLKKMVSVRASTPIFFARVLHSMAAEVPSRQAL